MKLVSFMAALALAFAPSGHAVTMSRLAQVPAQSREHGTRARTATGIAHEASGLFRKQRRSLRFEPLGADDGNSTDQLDEGMSDGQLTDPAGHDSTDCNESVTGSVITDFAGDSLPAVPTPWARYYRGSACQDARAHDRSKRYFMWCADHIPIIYSATYKFGYMKNPKVASTAFFTYFTSQFPDAQLVNRRDLPPDAYVFTFVRTPFEQKLSAYAEVELKESFNRTYGESQETLFQGVPRWVDHGRGRLSMFLDDIELERFEEADERQPLHVRSQIAGLLCTHMVNFIGHLENIGPDWARIQEEANLPWALRTQAVPVVHEGDIDQYLTDEHITLNDALMKRLCKMYRSDFVCLGYDELCSEHGFGA